MNIFKQYVDYVKDNPQGLWFKRKLYGWGWVPAKWQGWAVLALTLGYIILAARNIARYHTLHAAVPNGEVAVFLIKVILAVIFIIAMCYWKGESPRWQWGIKEDETQR